VMGATMPHDDVEDRVDIGGLRHADRDGVGDGAAGQGTCGRGGRRSQDGPGVKPLGPRC
jgi:hypothetical protein